MGNAFGADYPPFTADKPRFDQSTYTGRVRHFMDMVDPSTLLASKTDLLRAKDILQKYEAGFVDSGVTNVDLWEARKLRDSTLHPDTGEKILAPLRMSGFVPTNIPICVGLLMPNQSIYMTIFWQWINQSYNLASNFANRNASTEMTTQEILTAYGIAVTTSCSIAVGLGHAVKQYKFPTEAMRTLVSRTVPFFAVSSAGALNVILMRMKEMSEGVDVRDKDGNVLGTSEIAGKKAVLQTAFSRAIVPMPVLLLPPLIMQPILNSKLLKANKRLAMPFEVLTLSVCLFAFLPCGLALFPQVAEVPVTDLEQKFHDRRNKDGEHIKTVYFNKGL
eukprot:GFYU01021845.1.p1 GENE.GFYU01021845.1~~GFYU01021845.1.p1  ORF type:complete len:333 (-),score=79.35 GFYU01021845.1:263-1261(-)